MKIKNLTLPTLLMTALALGACSTTKQNNTKVAVEEYKIDYIKYLTNRIIAQAEEAALALKAAIQDIKSLGHSDAEIMTVVNDAIKKSNGAYLVHAELTNDTASLEKAFTHRTANAIALDLLSHFKDAAATTDGISLVKELSNEKMSGKSAPELANIAVDSKGEIQTSQATAEGYAQLYASMNKNPEAVQALMEEKTATNEILGLDIYGGKACTPGTGTLHTLDPEATKNLTAIAKEKTLTLVQLKNEHIQVWGKDAPASKEWKSCAFNAVNRVLGKGLVKLNQTVDALPGVTETLETVCDLTAHGSAASMSTLVANNDLNSPANCNMQ